MTGLLTFLGVPYKPHYSFWINNEADLEYIYNDFVKAARKVKCRLHPDNGGDAESFIRFNKFCIMATNSFRNHGIGGETAITATQTRENGFIRAKTKQTFTRSARH